VGRRSSGLSAGSQPGFSRGRLVIEAHRRLRKKLCRSRDDPAAANLSNTNGALCAGLFERIQNRGGCLRCCAGRTAPPSQLSCALRWLEIPPRVAFARTLEEDCGLAAAHGAGLFCRRRHRDYSRLSCGDGKAQLGPSSESQPGFSRGRSVIGASRTVQDLCRSRDDPARAHLSNTIAHFALDFFPQRSVCGGHGPQA
jgi:hypothetical protein